MGIFNFMKTKDERVASDLFKTIIVDNVYMIDIPKDWDKFESDRFRMICNDKRIEFSATNYGKEIKDSETFTIEDLKASTLPLFDKFVHEGDFESCEDLDIGKDYIYQAFVVDDETQYFYYTSRVIKMKTLARIQFVIYEKGEYKKETAELIKKIGESIVHKVADL